MSVYDDYSWDRLTEIRRKTLEENGGQLQGSWGVLQDKDGSKLYEGFLWHNRPYGPGAEYYKNGKVFREGIWDIKGIVAGREYYENGQLRFEGIWRIHLAYGPIPRSTAASLAKTASFYTAANSTFATEGWAIPAS